MAKAKLEDVQSPSCRYTGYTDCEQKTQKYQSSQCEYKEHCTKAKVLLLGMGADEQLAGYGRYRTKFRHGGNLALSCELKKDFDRLWKRNLGRDDRVISDCGREARFPFLDSAVVDFLQELPLEAICDMREQPGIGDKKLLREATKLLGLSKTSTLVKRAIQFGTRIANGKIKGTVQLRPSDLSDLSAKLFPPCVH